MIAFEENLDAMNKLNEPASLYESQVHTPMVKVIKTVPDELDTLRSRSQIFGEE